jgi:hypothetical protein
VRVVPTTHMALSVSTSVPLTSLAPHRGGSPAAPREAMC